MRSCTPSSSVRSLSEKRSTGLSRTSVGPRLPIVHADASLVCSGVQRTPRRAASRSAGEWQHPSRPGATARPTLDGSRLRPARWDPVSRHRRPAYRTARPTPRGCCWHLWPLGLPPCTVSARLPGLHRSPPRTPPPHLDGSGDCPPAGQSARANLPGYASRTPRSRWRTFPARQRSGCEQSWSPGAAVLA